ncbi:hypothetical protein L3556_08770 [Candidatus Synechococcus calcipolaris G9]|uniref:Uncharacterized protein n=1 Tax=Candidatus Synechococcus calcipolaris G9 TaxID=1497997 RepID=A0ABT6EZI5_9SYNE|nr:hypothetical protein [Candidatus Synechococcus calcipolaris]MDG2991016.1 hypothetical protein [Candidatus Synechococcus calcipolaris G9]
METPIIEAQSPIESEAIWTSLKRAIAHSSGFQRWQQEEDIHYSISQSNVDDSKVNYSKTDLDTQVSAYLRQALETLAY